MTTLYQLLLEQETSWINKVSAALAKVGLSPRLKKVLKLVGIAAVGSILSLAVATTELKRFWNDVRSTMTASLLKFKGTTEEQPAEQEAEEITKALELSKHFENIASTLAQSAMITGVIAFAVAVVLLGIIVFRESFTLVEDDEKKLSLGAVKAKAKECYHRASEALKKAAAVVKGKAKDLINYAKEHKKGAAIVVVLVVVGVAILIYLRRERIDAHTAIESLRSVGLTAKSPVVIGACIVGVLAIAAAIYFIYKKKKA